MSYTVQKLAELAGVSVRALHYYDQIGLLKPATLQANGYRLYETAELLRLQQILFFRELDFPLTEIKTMLNQSDFRVTQALQDHKALLKLKQKRLTQLIKTIDKTVHHMSTQQPMADAELYDAFQDNDVKQYQAEVKERWGNTQAYQQSMKRVSKMTKADMQKLKEDGKKFTQKLADHMDLPVTDPKVQVLIAEHYQGIQFFYDCPLDMYRNLGQMYVDDPRFTAYYDKFRAGLAIFVRDAIMHYCTVHAQ